MYRQSIGSDASIKKDLAKLIQTRHPSLDSSENSVKNSDLEKNEKNDPENDRSKNSESPTFDDNDSQLQYIFLIKENELKDGRMKQVNIRKNIDVLVIREKNDYYVLASKCANCDTPLIQGFLTKNRLYCIPYGTCYDIRTGYLEDYPGLYSQNTFKTLIKNGKVYIVTPPEMLEVNRKDKPMYKFTFKMVRNPTIIIGSGIAAITCAEVLRQYSYKDQILLLTKDNMLPYYRYSLSTNPNMPNEKLYLRDKNFYDINGIDIRLNAKVVKVDVIEKVVYCEDGKSFEYSNLVISTGTALKPIAIPGSNLENVLYFKNPNDGKVIYNNAVKKHVSILNCTPNIITLSTVLRKVARSTTIYNKENILFKEGGKDFNDQLVNYLEKTCNVSVRLKESIRSIEGDGKIQHLVLSNGFCAVSTMVIPSNGETACTSFMLGSKLKTTPDNYIEVDRNMRTNIPNVYAIGDCSIINFHKFQYYKNPIIMNSWQLSQVCGKICAMNILKKMVNLINEIQLLWFFVGEKIVVYVHRIDSDDEDTLSRGSFEKNDFITYFFKNNRVIGVICFGNTAPAIQIFECLKRRVSISRGEVEVMKSNNWSFKLF